MDLVFVGDRCNDHSASSGYDQVCSIFPDAAWLSGRPLEAGDVTWHRRPDRPTASSRRLYHVFYGDCSGRRLPAVLRSRFPDAIIACTAHQPVSRLVRDPQAMAALSHADAVITVSETQVRQLADLELTTSVHFVPHGVWTRAFRPAPGSLEDERDRVLLVGNYLRDWPGARHVTERLARAGVSCVLVGSNVPDDVFAGHESVERVPRLSEHELARMYDRSAALFLPVLDATASNALLEAMAAGCPVVCTGSTSLVDEYLGDRSDSFEEGDYDTAVARLLRYVGDPRKRASRSLALMKRAAEFDWSNLERRYAGTYDEIAQRANSSSIPATLSNEVSLTQDV